MDGREEDEAAGLNQSEGQMPDFLLNKNEAEQEIDFQKSEGPGDESQRSRPGGQDMQGTQPPRRDNLVAQEKSSLQDDEAVISPLAF
jgi:hypothetical protein